MSVIQEIWNLQNEIIDHRSCALQQENLALRKELAIRRLWDDLLTPAITAASAADSGAEPPDQKHVRLKPESTLGLLREAVSGMGNEPFGVQECKAYAIARHPDRKSDIGCRFDTYLSQQHEALKLKRVARGLYQKL